MDSYSSMMHGPYWTDGNKQFPHEWRLRRYPGNVLVMVGCFRCEWKTLIIGLPAKDLVKWYRYSLEVDPHGLRLAFTK